MLVLTRASTFITSLCWTSLGCSSSRFCGLATKTTPENKPFRWHKYKPGELKRLLDRVNRRLQYADAADYGAKRGRTAIRKLLQDELKKLRKVHPISNVRIHQIRREEISRELNDLLYTRHALLHGARSLWEFDNISLAKTFFGDKSLLVLEMIDAKKIIRDLFKYGRSETLKDKMLLEPYLFFDPDGTLPFEAEPIIDSQKKADPIIRDEQKEKKLDTKLEDMLRD
jgi:hypothetical protein